MTITPLPTPAPSRSQDQDAFDASVDLLYATALPQLISEMNVDTAQVNVDASTATAKAAEASDSEVNAAASAASAIALDSTNATSSTSVDIGTGSKSFTIETGKNFVPGMYVRIVDDAAPATNTMDGTITSYDSGTGALVVDIADTEGSGTKTAWTITISGRRGTDGTSDISLDTTPEQGGNLADGGFYKETTEGANIPSASTLIVGPTDSGHVTGTAGISSITTADKRLFTLVFDGILTITDGAPITIPGGANYTTSPGDRIRFRATAANTVEIEWITRADGTPVAFTNFISDIDVSGFSLVSSSNSDIPLTPNGTGQVKPGEMNLQDSLLLRAVFKDPAMAVQTKTGTTQTIDFTAGGWIKSTITATTTITVTNPSPSPHRCLLVLQMTNGGAGAITWPPGITPPELTASGKDLVFIWTTDAGTSWDLGTSQLDY